jgi:transcriptional regulator with XRE-family HTH domain
MLREKNGWTQERLAELTSKKQETISQWENPNYGSYTLNSLKSLAEAFDVALLVEFVPYSELVERNTTRTPQRLAPPSFAEEDKTRDAAGNELFSPTLDVGQPQMLHAEATIHEFQRPLPMDYTSEQSPASPVKYLREPQRKVEIYASQSKIGTARAAQ